MDLATRIQETVLLSPAATFIFLVTIATSIAAFQNPLLKARFILQPSRFVHEKKYYTILTSGLIHANYLHLGMNLLAFYFFAFELDKFFVLIEAFQNSTGEPSATQDTINKLLGHGKFVILYVGCLVISDMTSIIRHKDNPAYASLGASGALSGVLTSAVIMFGASIKIWGLPGWVFVLGFLGLSYYNARYGSNDNIGHEAHLWGAIGGIFLTPILYPDRSWRFVQEMAETFSSIF
ncbi:MAG: rhomboid family intramembrane serine protease [Bacteroidota bacterium]